MSQMDWRMKDLLMNKATESLAENLFTSPEAFHDLIGCKAYLKGFKEPFIDDRDAKIYEWEDDKGIRFRVITDVQRGGSQLPLSPSEHPIIAFFAVSTCSLRSSPSFSAFGDFFLFFWVYFKKLQCHQQKHEIKCKLFDVFDCCNEKGADPKEYQDRRLKIMGLYSPARR